MLISVTLLLSFDAAAGLLLWEKSSGELSIG